MKSATDLKILMISLDPVLLGQGGGDVLQRHIDYASRVSSLDIIVLGGATSTTQKITEKLTIHSTGGQGILKAIKAYSIGSKLCHLGIDLIDTQDPHMTGLIGWFLKKKFNLPLEVHCHGDFINNTYWRDESWKNLWYERLQKFILPRADGVRVVSSLIADKIREHQLTQAQVVTINTPVNTEIFLKHQAQPDPDYFTVVANVRLVSAKNIPFSLAVIKQLSQNYDNIRYRIIGSGPLQRDLEKQVNDLELASVVTFLGTLSPEQVVREFAQANVLLLVSTNESFGKVIIEAGLMSVPSVASATLGARTIIIPEQTGLVVPINDMETTVQALIRLRNNPTECQQMGQASRDAYSRIYSRQNSIDQILEFWSALINKKHE